MPVLEKVIGLNDKSSTFYKQREEEIYRLMLNGYLGDKELT
jgi:hypothetical protein